MRRGEGIGIRNQNQKTQTWKKMKAGRIKRIKKSNNGKNKTNKKRNKNK